MKAKKVKEMFQISRRADYAVRTMLVLGDQAEDICISAQKVSEKTDVPLPFLRKITADLVKAKLVVTYAGQKGGLALSSPTSEINLLQILEAVEGPICLNACLLRPGECPRDLTCPGHDFWGRLQTLVVQKLEETSLEQLVIDGRNLQKSPRQSEIRYVIHQD